MNVNDGKMYGYMSKEPKESTYIKMPKGQNIGGYGVGILHLDNVWYPFVPGNVVNAWTYKYPVRFKAVKGLDTPTLHSGAPEAFDVILAAAKELEKEGCRAISGACGFFGNFQKQLADAMDIPVAISSMVQLPWIRTLLKPNQKIGVISADVAAISKEMLASCGITKTDDIVYTDLCHAENFRAILEDLGSFDNTGVRNDVVNAAVRMVTENPDIGAILLECSDMPPYAWEIQAATKRPVFDFITLINWLENAVQQRPYDGWI